MPDHCELNPTSTIRAVKSWIALRIEDAAMMPAVERAAACLAYQKELERAGFEDWIASFISLRIMRAGRERHERRLAGLTP